VKGDIGDAAVLGGSEIGAAGITAISGGLPRWRAGAADVAVEHRREALGVGRVAGFDDDIEDQSALAGCQVELVPVLNLTTALDDDSACGSNRLTSFSPAGTVSPSKTRRWVWDTTHAISDR
jgi:hypothetical protein